jgi:hypothetical protein
VQFALDCNASPLAVMASVVEFKAAVEAALSVSVDTVLLEPAGEKPLLLQVAVTPAGKPVTARFTAPAYEPPVVAVTATVAVLA